MDYINDIEILRALNDKIDFPFEYVLKNNKCIKLSLNDESKSIFSGLIRHHSAAQKMEILELIFQIIIQ